jgi:hypothetical protein
MFFFFIILHASYYCYDEKNPTMGFLCIPDLSFCFYWVMGDDRQQLSSAYNHFIAACLVF